MSDQIVITEKSSQAKDVRAAVGARYGDVLAAEGHLLDLMEPGDVDPEWKRWTPVLLRPPGLYATRPADGGNKAAKLAAIRQALRTAKRVWLATDCDREGQLIGQEILEHYRYRGEVMRVMFTAQDPQTIRDAFARARPNREYAALYAAAVARRQADQIYNLSLTRTATVVLGGRGSGVIGIGRVKTPTLAIVCVRELEIRNFVPVPYFEVVATGHVTSDAGEPATFQMRHAPKPPLLERAKAEAVVAAARGHRGPLRVRVDERQQKPPKLHDLPSLQKLCAARFGWNAAKTLEIAQSLYDGQGRKIITYPRAEVRYLPSSLIPDVPRIIAGLRVGQTFAAIPMPPSPVIRRGAAGTFHDKGLEGASHHAVIPNVNTIDTLREVWPRLSLDEKRLFDIIARAYLAAMMPDYRYLQTTVTFDAAGYPFRASGRQPLEAGWRAAFPDWQPSDEKTEDAATLPALRDGQPAQLREPKVEAKETRPPPRYNEGTLIEAMQNAWRFVEDAVLRERLVEAKGIGTPATRAQVIDGLKKQGFLVTDGKHIVPTDTGLQLFGVLQRADPALVDPGVTARMECQLDDVLSGKQAMTGAIDAVCDVATRIIGVLKDTAASGASITTARRGPGEPATSPGGGARGRRGRGGTRASTRAAPKEPTEAMKRYAEHLARELGVELPQGYAASGATCRTFLKKHARTPGDAGVQGEGDTSRKPRAARKRVAATAAKTDAATASTAVRAPRAKAASRRRSTGAARVASEAMPAAAQAAPAANTRAKGRRATAARNGSAPGRGTRSAVEHGADEVQPAAMETALRIPYGNKDAARLLGARYRDGRWYAPPGVDLMAFRRRGWL